jgi:hypothetical protein
MKSIQSLIIVLVAVLLQACAQYNPYNGQYPQNYPQGQRDTSVPAENFAAPVKRFVREAEEVHVEVMNFNPCGAGGKVVSKTAESQGKVDLKGRQAGVEIKTNSAKRLDCK